LLALRDGDRDRAAELVASRPGSAADGGDRLATAIERHVTSGAFGAEVYVDPLAFARFIDDRPNVELYRATITALSAWLDRGPASAVADIGCGDGRVSVDVADRPGTTIELVEPSSAMLSEALDRFTKASVVGRRQTVQEWLSSQQPVQLDAAWSTFALHTLDSTARLEVLAGLHRRVERLAIVEFDIPAFATPESHATYCAARYRQGLADHRDDLVRRDFLIPVLVGQFAPDAPRHTHEQPLQRWAEQVREAGFARVEVLPVHDGFWWGPAGMVVAERTA
jgi:SAM-dependent methyltransferase